MNPNGLNEAQRRAATHTNGPMLVLAGPGSGKTTVILHRVKHLIEACGVEARRILVVTFAKTAATEMRTRYQALSPDGGVTFSTLHALFFRVLRDAKHYPPESVVDGVKRREILRALMKEHGIGRHTDTDAVERLSNELSRIKSSAGDASANISGHLPRGVSRDVLRVLYEAYEHTLAASGQLDFDGMLTECHALFTGNPKELNCWRERYHYILVDEFQDVNRLQYECIQMLAAPRNNLFVVGDDDQSIYGFRGANPSFMLHFRNDYPNAEMAALEANYRSTASIIALANAVIQGNAVRSRKQMLCVKDTGESPVAAYPQDAHGEAEWLAEKILAMQNMCPYEEMAVIFRMHIQAQTIIDVFTRRRIPFTIREAAPSMHTHWIAKDMQAYMSLAINRRDDEALAAVINKPTRYIYKDAVARAHIEGKAARQGALAALYESERLTRRHFAALDMLTLGLNALQKRNAYDAVRYLREGIGYNEYLAAHAKIRGLDLHTLLDMADALQESARGFADISEWLAHTKAAAHMQKPKQTDSPAPHGVLLSTMHGAKGLEFDVVFVAGAVDGIVPHKDCLTAQALEEERRLLYVALTRARRLLYISAYRESRGSRVSPSRFLEPFLSE